MPSWNSRHRNFWPRWAFLPGQATTRTSFPAVSSSVWPLPRALALHPDILCFDEPTSALDPELTGEVLRVLRDPCRPQDHHDHRHPRDALCP